VRNDGEKLSKGEYLFFCDSDVILYPNAFEVMVQKLQSNLNCSWVYCNFKWGDRVLAFAPFNRQKMFEVNCSSTMSMMKHDKFVGFDESLVKLQDWDLFLTIMKNGNIGVWENQVLFETPDRKDGITNGSIPEIKAREILRKKHVEIKML
jgi:glycosyltransferase involved in cell wall biosynthesis